jgi:hypothetical protein
MINFFKLVHPPAAGSGLHSFWLQQYLKLSSIPWHCASVIKSIICPSYYAINSSISTSKGVGIQSSFLTISLMQKKWIGIFGIPNKVRSSLSSVGLGLTYFH